MHLARLGWVAFVVSSLGACGAEHSQGAAAGGLAGTDGQGGSAAMAAATGGTAAGASGTVRTGGASFEQGGGPAQGGAAQSGGTATGGAAMGGASAGGAPSGGAPETGGAGPVSGGRTAFGGTGPGGTDTGGAASGGRARGGSDAGGASTGGAAPSGGRGTGGASTGGAASGGRPSVIAEPGSKLVKIDPGVRHQTFEGWGTSLCWWAHRIGGWSADKRNEFLDRMIVDPTTGLGYNVFRYNIGGGENPAHNHMTEGRDMPGFEPSQGSWDWQADARQTSVLSRLAESAQDAIFEAFSNSPPYWMTKSGCASGSSDGSDNLKEDSYDLFADYLTEVVKHYRDEIGITFRTLEPMNEPNASWWKANGGQEGCHFGAASQRKLIQAVGAKLQEKGLPDTRVSASDENSMDDALSIMSGYDATTLGYMVQMNVHSYAGSRRSELRALATSKGKRLWQSESGPLSVTLDSNTDAAIFMAGRIITDLRELEPEAWVDWQTVDTSTPWTSFSVNDAQQTWTPQKRFYMHAGFSRFIRPGATFVDIDNAEMVAAVAADGSVLTVVVRNGDKSATVSYTFDLTALASVGSSIEVYRTSASENLAQLPSIQVNNWSFVASSAPYSVTTYLIALSG